MNPAQRRILVLSDLALDSTRLERFLWRCGGALRMALHLALKEELLAIDEAVAGSAGRCRVGRAEKVAARGSLMVSKVDERSQQGSLLRRSLQCACALGREGSGNWSDGLYGLWLSLAPRKDVMGWVRA